VRSIALAGIAAVTETRTAATATDHRLIFRMMRLLALMHDRTRTPGGPSTQIIELRIQRKSRAPLLAGSIINRDDVDIPRDRPRYGTVPSCDHRAHAAALQHEPFHGDGRCGGRADHPPDGPGVDPSLHCGKRLGLVVGRRREGCVRAGLAPAASGT
jgi:hypothetical protein